MFNHNLYGLLEESASDLHDKGAFLLIVVPVYYDKYTVAHNSGLFREKWQNYKASFLDRQPTALPLKHIVSLYAA